MAGPPPTWAVAGSATPGGAKPWRDQGGAFARREKRERRTRGGQAQAPRRRHRAEDLARATRRRAMVGGRARGLGPRLRSHDRRAHRGGVLRPAPPSPARRRRRARGRDADPPRARVVARVVRDRRRGGELVLARGGTVGGRARARWVHQARRVTALALDAVSRAEAGTEEEDALASCAARLVSILRAPSAWKFPIPGGGAPGAGKPPKPPRRRWRTRASCRGAREASRAGVRRVGRADAARRPVAYYAAGDDGCARRRDPARSSRRRRASHRAWSSIEAPRLTEANAAAVRRVMAVPLLHARMPAGTATATTTRGSPLDPDDDDDVRRHDVWPLTGRRRLDARQPARALHGVARGGWRVVVAEARRRLSTFARLGRGSPATAAASLVSMTGER